MEFLGLDLNSFISLPSTLLTHMVVFCLMLRCIYAYVCYAEVGDLEVCWLTGKSIWDTEIDSPQILKKTKHLPENQEFTGAALTIW